MKKKLLFIAPDYYGFNEVVLNGLKEYSDYEVTHIVSNLKYKYKSIGERIYNFFSKIFLGRNLKKEMKEKYIRNVINRYEYYDILLVNGPYTLTNKELSLALEKSKTSITIFWDSIEKIPMQKDYLDVFDIIYSFDPEDCKKYNLKRITNFYFIEDNNQNNLYDVAYLATYDDRIKDTEIIFKYFEKHNISVKGKMFIYKSDMNGQTFPENIEVINDIIPFSESYKHYLDCKIILDIAHPHQEGLSFRPYEAMGLRKKLITTNKDIVNYDFYTPNNIFVINDVNNFTIPDAFLKTDYQEIAEPIKSNYHIRNWVHNILSIDDKH